MRKVPSELGRWGVADHSTFQARGHLAGAIVAWPGEDPRHAILFTRRPSAPPGRAVLRPGGAGGGWSAAEHGKGFGDVGVVTGGHVLGGGGDVVVGRDADPVDDLVVGADLVLEWKPEEAAVAEGVAGSRARDDAGGAGADQ